MSDERRKRRYAEDAEYRERLNADRRARYAARKSELNARRRREYATLSQAQRRALSLGRRRRQLLERYGISLEQYEAILARQGGACAICREPARGTLAVDHCHATGEVRGLLCFKCNVVLGLCEDDPGITLAAIAYLEADDPLFDG